MKRITFTLAAAALLAAGCTSNRTPPPQIAEGTPTESFSYQATSFLRGVRGSYNTSPRGRSAALLDVRYGFTCASGSTPSAKARSQAAFNLVKDNYTVAPLYFDNPRERGAWSRSVSRAVFDETGCVGGVSFETKTTEPLEVFSWALKNRVPPARR